MANRLGRGLDLLLGPKLEQTPQGIKEIPVEAISHSPYQPRKDFNEAQLKTLAESIKSLGVLEPVLVSSRPTGGYTLLAGERRLRAARLAGLKTVPAIIKNYANKEAALIGLVENVQRADLNPIDLAQAIENLCEEFNLTHEEAAQLVGLSRPRVSNLLRLLNLEDEIREYIAIGHLSEGQAKALLSMDDPAQRLRVAREIAQGTKTWNVREIERERKPQQDANIASLEEELQKKLGTKIKITWRGKKRPGWISLQFVGLDHFETLKQKLLALS